MHNWVDFWSHAQSEVDDPRQVRKEFSSSGKLAKAEWFAPLPLSGRLSRGA
jgi:hypothetical protein